MSYVPRVARPELVRAIDRLMRLRATHAAMRLSHPAREPGPELLRAEADAQADVLQLLPESPLPGYAPAVLLQGHVWARGADGHLVVITNPFRLDDSGTRFLGEGAEVEHPGQHPQGSQN